MRFILKVPRRTEYYLAGRNLREIMKKTKEGTRFANLFFESDQHKEISQKEAQKLGFGNMLKEADAFLNRRPEETVVVFGMRK